ncbi:MAG: M28 family peptidase [Chloroflexi bacterium]|nr:M28 family peptidase [Chloroflexota bacterium]
MRSPTSFRIGIGAAVILLLVAAAVYLAREAATGAGREFGSRFDGERAYADVLTQTEFGPRPSGSPAHAQTIAWLVESLGAAGWEAEIQELSIEGQTVKNVIARRGAGPEWIILGAHYDTRLLADEDPDPARRAEPVLGANDGASGVAVLLELARVLPKDPGKEIWLAFFDAEDNGRIPGWDWILGSRAFVDALAGRPSAAVIVDMVGDADLQLYQERNSDPILTEQIWAMAARLGYTQFIPEPKFSMLDDHTPFVQAGIPAVDIIDFDYPYWHTTADTAEKVSAESLEAVGATLLAWLLGE